MFCRIRRSIWGGWRNSNLPILQILRLVKPKFWQFFRRYARHSFADGADQIAAAVAVQKWDSPPFLGKMGAHPFRMIGVILEDVLLQREQAVVRFDELTAVFLRDFFQVADNPAKRLEFPLISQPGKPIIGCDIRKEGKLPATQGPEGALAGLWSQAGQQNHRFGCFGLQFLAVWPGGAFIAAPDMP